MPRYEVRFYYGDYSYRQKLANKDQAILYVEHHFNADNKGVGNYCMALVAHNASEKSIQVGKTYVAKVNSLLGVPISSLGEDGVYQTKPKERGDFNLRYTVMPAVLLEPLFVSNIEHVKLFFDGGREKLAQALAETIKEEFPEGGLIAFSVGHKYKRTKPLDRGAFCWGRPEFTEADLAEQVLWLAKFELERD